MTRRLRRVQNDEGKEGPGIGTDQGVAACHPSSIAHAVHKKKDKVAGSGARSVESATASSACSPVLLPLHHGFRDPYQGQVRRSKAVMQGTRPHGTAQHSNSRAQYAIRNMQQYAIRNTAQQICISRYPAVSSSEHDTSGALWELACWSGSRATQAYVRPYLIARRRHGKPRPSAQYPAIEGDFPVVP